MILKPKLFRKLRKGHWATKGLVGFWLFNEGSGGQVFDLSGNGNTGTLQGTSPSWSAGKFGPAVLFPGTDEYAYFGTGVDIDDGTISIWVKPTGGHSSADDTKVIFSKYVDGSNKLTIEFHRDGFIQAGIKKNNVWEVLHQTAQTSWNEQFYHVVLTFGSGGSKLYVDAIETNSSANTTDASHLDAGGTYLGNLNGVDNFWFNGAIDNGLIHNHILFASEIALLYREPFCMFERDLIELWSPATLGAPQVGAAGIMTTNTGYWGPTF